MRTPRTLAGTRRSAGALLVAATALLSLAGCDPRTLLYFLQADTPSIPAPGPDLTGKKVVVVSHAVSGALAEFQTLDRDMASEVVSLLRAKVKKIEVIPMDKVWAWTESHPNWSDPAELLKEFEADVVIFLEIEGFSVQNAGDLNVLQGAAKTHIQVTERSYPKNSKGKPEKDKPKESKKIYDEYTDTEFPVRGPIPYDSGVSRGAFKSKFLKVTSAEVSWHFVGHNSDDMIQDVKFNNR